MWNVKFYMLPSNDYSSISHEDLLELDENINTINQNDIAYIPNEFYVKKDINDISASDFLYQQEQTDLSDFLLSIVQTQKTTEKNYLEIDNETEKGYIIISEGDSTSKKEELCIKNTQDIYQKGTFIPNDIIKIKRSFLNNVSSYEMFNERCIPCYPALVFHEDAFINIKKLGKISEVLEELIRHLNALNDYGNIIYNDCNKNEESALNILKSKCHITCSGKGSNENHSFKKSMYFKGNTYYITCNSHTKFYKGNNDQRIYFSWGRKEIDNYKLIIISVGPHWDKQE